LWKATDEFLKAAAKAPVSAIDVYSMWKAKPFGVREGIRPVLLVAYLLSRADRYTVYLNERLEVALNDVTIDRLTADPSALTVRVFDAGDRARRLFEAVRSILEEATGVTADLKDTVALAKAIVGLVKAQPLYAQRTQRLSAEALAIRGAIRAATDPHTLLHESLPSILDTLLGRVNAPVDASVELLSSALREIGSTYKRTLEAIGETLRRELDSASMEGAGPIRERAKRIRGLTGDFRLEAFIARLCTYEATSADIEGIASLAANKPPRDWSDNDVDRAHLDVARLAQQFNRAEAFARVKGRADGRHAVAFVIGLDGSPGLQAREFEITERDRHTVLELARVLQGVLASTESSAEIRLAALAQVGSTMLEIQE
jgi:hypothetical protein